jgi:hypothetical protein
MATIEELMEMFRQRAPKAENSVSMDLERLVSRPNAATSTSRAVPGGLVPLPKRDLTPESQENITQNRIRWGQGQLNNISQFDTLPGQLRSDNYLKAAEDLMFKANQVRQKTSVQHLANAGGGSYADMGTSSPADIITANLQGRRQNFKGIKQDVDELLENDPGIIGFQEAGNIHKIRRLKEYLRSQGYGFYGRSNNPIAFNKDQYKRVAKGSEFLTPATYVGPAGAGPNTLREKFANWLVLQQRGGGPLRSVTNVHNAPTRRLPVRRYLQTQQINGTLRLQRELANRFPELQRIVLGDFNVSKTGPLQGFERLGLDVEKSPYRTHRVGTPDWIIGDNLKNFRVEQLNSDHNALIADLKGGPKQGTKIKIPTGIGAPVANNKFANFVNAIAGKESGGSYSAVNKDSGALGKYQIMPGNFVGPGGWDRDALGRDITAQQFLNSPKLQDRIARYKLRKYFKEYGVRGAASAWYSGDPNKWRNTSPQGGYPSIAAYVNDILRRMGLI